MVKELNLPAQRGIIMEMIFNMVKMLLPQDTDGMPVDLENRIVEIYSALSYTLQIPEEESI